MKFVGLLFVLLVPLAVLIGLVSGLSAGNQDVITVCPRDCDRFVLGRAVKAAYPGSTISVGAGTYTGTVSINKPVTIAGSGPASTALDGGAAGPVLVIHETAVVTVSLVTIVNGLALVDQGQARGGGVYNLGHLKLVSVTLANNAAIASKAAGGSIKGHAYGGGIFNGCEKDHCGHLRLVDSLLAENLATGSPTSAKAGGG